MKVICTGNRGRHLPVSALEKSGNAEHAIFHITIGREYIVCAMALWDSGLGVLIADDTEKPRWYHIELFELVDGRLPADWEFVTVNGDEYRQVLALWGYSALIQNVDHHDDLVIRGKKAALDVFFEERDRRVTSD